MSVSIMGAIAILIALISIETVKRKHTAGVRAAAFRPLHIRP